MTPRRQNQRFGIRACYTCCLVGGLAFAAQAAEFEWKPVSASGSHTITNNQIVLNGANQQVTLELRVSGWDPNLDGNPQLGAYQATLASSGYTSGSGAALSPLTSPNASAGAFIVTKRCTVGQQADPNGQRCDLSPTCPAGAFCIDNPAFVFANLQPLGAVATAEPDYQFGATIQALQGKVDGGIEYYAGTLIVVVPSGAQGTYTLDFIDDPNKTFMVDFFAAQISPIVTTPATIVIACATSTDCNDNNACTNDVCNPNNTCSNPLNYNPATHCCNPANGQQTLLTDNNQCTADNCNASNGQVTHPPLASGTACGSPASSECDQPDSCNGSGVCLSNFRPSGFACGSPTNTECDLADTCNGTGTCQTNRPSAGTPCGNPTNSDCTDPDTCNGLGNCLPNDVPNGTTCNDGLFCTQGEQCSGGACGGGSLLPCDDGRTCTSDACNESTDQCENTLLAGNCLIAGVCYADGELNPTDTCQECDPATNPGSFTTLPQGTLCDDGNPCTGTGSPGVGFDTCDAQGVCTGQPDPECNDNCSTAVPIFEGTNAGYQNNSAGPVDDDEASCQPDSNKDIWFSYTATCSGPVFLSTSGSVFTPTNDSVLSVYTSCGGMEIACDDDSGVGLHAALIFNAVNGVTYFLRVAGFEDNEGSVQVNISTVAGCLIDGVCYAEDDLNPANDCEICLPDVSTTAWSPRLEGSACGDPSDTQCDSPDACDGAGVCETNHKPDLTACVDDGEQCTFDYCIAGLCAHPPVAVDTPCGDPTDTECDEPDTCDGNGVCLDNFRREGFPCGDPTSNQCDNPDSCDGSGACLSNYEPTGTPCDDGDICTEDDECDVGLCAGTPVPASPVLGNLGPKAFKVTAQPPGSPVPVALHVTSPTWPCLSKYVQANGTLDNNPVFQTPNQWGIKIIKGALVVPGSTYRVVAECGAFASAQASISTCPWGDVDCNQVVNFTDIQYLLLAFQGNFGPGIPFAAMDIDPCTPQGVINFTDIQRDVLAFQGQTYAQTGCPVPCP